MMTDPHANLPACHTCPLAKFTAAGRAECTVDGADIIEHAAAGHCPHPAGSRFEGRPPRPAPPPRPSPRPIEPVPRDQWPFPIKCVALAASEADRGVGDTAHRVLAAAGANALAELYEKATGRPCGCADRQGRLNALYPYAPAESPPASS